MGGEARSKRGGRWGRDGAHRRGGRKARRCEDGATTAIRSADADTRLGKERRGGGDGVLGARS
jgi:hypothetical protein